MFDYVEMDLYGRIAECVCALFFYSCIATHNEAHRLPEGTLRWPSLNGEWLCSAGTVIPRQPVLIVSGWSYANTSEVGPTAPRLRLLLWAVSFRRSSSRFTAVFFLFFLVGSGSPSHRSKIKFPPLCCLAAHRDPTIQRRLIAYYRECKMWLSCV